MPIRLLLNTSAILLVLTPVMAYAADPVSDDLSPRAEVSVKGGSERSVLTTEFWAPLAQQSGRVLYGDLRLMGDNDDNREGNLGLGYRQISETTNSVLGGHLWIDRRRTEHNSTFHQVTIGAESLGTSIDLRANAYIPLNGANNVTTPNLGSNTPYLAGSGVFYDTNGSVSETPQYGADAEIGYRVPILKKQFDTIRIYGGAYSFFRNDTDSVNGYRVRTEAVINSIFSVGARFQHDAPRGDQGFLEATIRFPFSAKKLYQSKGLYGRLDESPERDVDIVTSSKATSGLMTPFLNASGTQQRILYVDNSQTNGDGTKEHPFNNLTSAQTALQANDILYVAHGNGTTSGMDHGITITQNNVQLIGSGSALTVGGYTFLQAGQAPVITNIDPFVDNGMGQTVSYTGNGVFITSNNVSVSGLNIRNAKAEGILVYYPATASNISGSLSFTNNTVTGNGQHGIFVVVDGDKTIDNMTFTNNNVDYNGFRGIWVWGVNGTKIGNLSAANNTFVSNNLDAFWVLTNNTGGMVNNASVVNNTILNNGAKAIYINPTNGSNFGNITIQNNTISNVGGDGIAITTTGTSLVDSILLDSNNVIGAGGSGTIVLVRGTSVVNNITANNSIVSNNLQYGLNIQSNGGIVNHVTISNIIANNNGISGVFAAANAGTVGAFDISNITTNANTQQGVQVYSSSFGILGQANLTNISANNNGINGLYIYSSGFASAATISNVTFNNVVTNSNRGTGVVVAMDNAGVIGSVTGSGITSNNNSFSGLSISASTGVLNSINISNATFNNNIVDGTRLLVGGVGSKISNANFNNITANNNLEHGLWVISQSSGILDNLSVSNMTTNNNAQNGSYIYALSSAAINNITLTNNTSNSNTQQGLSVRADAATINRMTISGETTNNNIQNGIYIYDTASTSIINNISIANSNMTGNSVNGIYLQKDFAGATQLVDLGGGALNSSGQNRIFSNTTKDIRVNYAGGGNVFARSNWWGNVSGLQASQYTLSASTTIDSTAFLTTDPRP